MIPEPALRRRERERRRDPVAAIASPAILTVATLNNATLTVSLERTTYASGVTAASFELVTEGIADAARSIASATATAGTRARR